MRRLSQATIRRAREGDAGAIAPLLYESAAAMYDRFTGGSSRATRVLMHAFEAEGNNASAEVITVAELEGNVAAAMAAFPVEEMPARAHAFLRLTLRCIPPWRWPGCLRLYYLGMRASPEPPRSAFYVDALATDRSLRRRGAARALLHRAEQRARELGLPAVALDTALTNTSARSLYLGAGYEEVGYRASARGLPGFVALVKPL
jgi:ribosomal protein S18 acetylase RimI-like enzyme